METRNSNRFSRADQSERALGRGSPIGAAYFPDPVRSGLSGAGPEREAPFAILPQGIRTRGRLWADAAGLARQLPDGDYLVNLCEDRYAFCLALLAAAMRGQVALLPPSLQAGILREILDAHPRAYLAGDRDLVAGVGAHFRVIPPAEETRPAERPSLDYEHAAVIAFTSGSTGRPKPCRHSLATFAASASMALAALGLANESALVVSTTPPQHMFGLETSIFWPLFSGLALHPGRPFFPEDLRRTVLSAARPCLLATTPAHLSAVVRTGGDWGNLRAVICSTSSLSPELARQAEALFGAPVIELYGSTETLSLASRRTARESPWRPYEGVRLTPRDSGKTGLATPHLPAPVELDDQIRPERDGRFSLLGRDSDMIKIGGKRGSLADLNHRLASVAGLRDGLFHAYQDARGHDRLAAVVVGEADRSEIIEGLRPYLDELFLPRRIHHVAEIPRNETGKVLRENWRALLATLGYGDGSGTAT
ncbi:AMP-binding protein [Methylococcus sp. EFPC2]|uniref:AMP-binding protein n=1 Tax=Methylococcus sp. EFPC2 TaxID=2812648 RepID=UPI0019673274|nr:AMP-binding protein [Methylococcus sp. EFPC2]QSA98852.1 acyl-CoA synthetase [Methylococcus sp. EFPC2]